MPKNDEMMKIPGVKGSPIEGVIVQQPKKIFDERGAIFHMLREDNPSFERFGEIYFSMIYPGVIKGWHIHSVMSLNYAVVSGQIKLVLYDDRVSSPTVGNLMEIFMGDGSYLLVKVPPRVWNGFKGIGVTSSLVANCATHPHDPLEIARKEPMTKDIPYDWSLCHG